MPLLFLLDEYSAYLKFLIVSLNIRSIAMICLIGVYYIINFEYSPHVARVLSFLQQHMLNLKPAKCSDSLVELSIKLGLHLPA